MKQIVTNGIFEPYRPWSADRKEKCRELRRARLFSARSRLIASQEAKISDLRNKVDDMAWELELANAVLHGMKLMAGEIENTQ